MSKAAKAASAAFSAIVVAAAIVAGLVPSAAAAAAGGEFGIEQFEAGTCSENSAAAKCTYETPEKFYTQAAGHPNYGITDFKFNVEEPLPGLQLPIGKVRDVRVDLPTGLSVNPFSVPQCTEEELESTDCAGTPNARVGVDEISIVTVGPAAITIPVPVFNIVPRQGAPAQFGFVVPTQSPTYLVGGVSWHDEAAVSGGPSGDFHEYFTISEIPDALPFVESRLVFEGKAFEPAQGSAPFLTMPSGCLGPQTTYMEAVPWEGKTVRAAASTPVGVTGCTAVPFKPEVAVKPQSTASDQPDGATVEVKVPQNKDPEGINSSTVKDVNVTLPEGMTLNPSVATGLQACTDAQFGRGTDSLVSCPGSAQIGTVRIETPNLPPGSLTGKVYVGEPLSNDPESGKEYRIFIAAESARYGVSVRLLGSVSANASTGRLTTAVLEDPPIPFSDFVVALDGPNVALANPLSCGLASTLATLAPYSGAAASSAASAFAVDLDGHGGACPAAPPFDLTQGASTSPTTGGANTSLTFTLSRDDGEQYLARLSTTLPEGLVGKIPAVPLCGEPQASEGNCPAASKIGEASVSVGSGPHPYTLSGGTVYLTGRYGGAPYGLSITVPAQHVGPYDYGVIVTRAKIDVDPYTAQVTVTSALPTVIGGVPIRLKSLRVTIDRSGFLVNPTSCATLSTHTVLTSTFGATASLSTPFAASGCESLAFKPGLKAQANAKTSRRIGAGIKMKITTPPGGANIARVRVTLPKKLPSRGSTLKQACLAEVFAVSPYSCPIGSQVGGATVRTPVLPRPLTGPAYLVSHGGAAFPDLDLVLKGAGVTVVLVGQTNIKKGITHSTFASLPDVPIDSVVVKLPVGKHSMLSAIGSLCRRPLYMPTTIVAANGKKTTKKARLVPFGCKIEVVRRRVKRERAIVTVHAPAAGTIVARGAYLRTQRKRVSGARMATLTLPLTRKGAATLKRRGHLKVRVRVRLRPRNAKTHGSQTSAVLRIRR